MKYKNCSSGTYVFYGKTFKPGDIHDVPAEGVLHPQFIRIDCDSEDSVVIDVPKEKIDTELSSAESTAVDQDKKEEIDGKNNNKRNK